MVGERGRITPLPPGTTRVCTLGPKVADVGCVVPTTPQRPVLPVIKLHSGGRGMAAFETPPPPPPFPPRRLIPHTVSLSANPLTTGRINEGVTPCSALHIRAAIIQCRCELNFALPRRLRGRGEGGSKGKRVEVGLSRSGRGWVTTATRQSSSSHARSSVR